MTDLAMSATPTADVATQDTGTTGGVVENVQPGSDAAGQTATASENFLPQGVDVNSLPPVLRAELDRINKEMVRGFTAKTQKHAEQLKAAEAFKQEAELFRQYKPVFENEEFVRMWNDFVKAQQTPATAEQNVDPKYQELEQKVQAMEQRAQRAEALEYIDAFAGAVGEDGQRLRPDFDRLEAAVIDEGNNLMNVCVDIAKTKAQSPQEALQMGYDLAKKLYDAIFEEGRKAAIGKVTSKLRNGTNPPSMSTTQSIFTGDPKKIDARQAFELAKKGIRVPTE